MLENDQKINTDRGIGHVNHANYSALWVLEQMGLDAPSQKQINIIETLILIAIKPTRIPFQLIKSCIASDAVARRIFFRHLSSKLKPRSKCNENLNKSI